MRRFGPTCLLVAAFFPSGWIALALVCCCLLSFGAEPGTPGLPGGRGGDETNAQEVLRSWLQVQEQLHATQLAIERNRQETDATAARSAEALANRLQGIEQTLAAQRAQELEAIQSSNRVMLIVAGSFAALGLLGRGLPWLRWVRVTGIILRLDRRRNPTIGCWRHSTSLRSVSLTWNTRPACR